MVEPTSQMRILSSIHILVNESEEFSILIRRSITNAVRVIKEVLVKLFESLEDYTIRTQNDEDILIVFTFIVGKQTLNTLIACFQLDESI